MSQRHGVTARRAITPHSRIITWFASLRYRRRQRRRHPSGRRRCQRRRVRRRGDSPTSSRAMAMRSFVKLRPGQQSYGQRVDMRKYNEAMYQMEVQTWRPYRLFALFSSFCALSFTTIAICNKYWYIGKDWQNAVIGLLIFSVAFGFLATILSICGVCTTQLAKKIYYYHSAGEIYLICALATAAALVVYPVAIEVKEDLSEHSFGVGYGLGWVASMFFLASALCMCLDDLVRAFARGLCKCCRRDSGGDTRV
ncbi:hypothetical protein LSH36_798g01048 [Paralvinella palmiformis]|uniref:Uncharacterized protein n=1 Tax=Paralvinella palmiformis TaxID=53620 RepID=A0AAD9IZN8_9ANNE|nr:hypothetical protein LSH36_798g01048 [Paralvinella palmiformis]